MIVAIAVLAIGSAMFHALAIWMIFDLAHQVVHHRKLHDINSDFMNSVLDYNKQIDRDIDRIDNRLARIDHEISFKAGERN